MAKLLSDLALGKWQLGVPRAAKQMAIAGIRANGTVPNLQLAPKAEIGSIWTPFAPSVYGGNGSEPRKSIVFSIPDDARRQMEAVEEWCRDALRESTPNIDAIWRSSIRPPAQYPASLRAKITLAGPSACSFFDEEGNSAQEPGNWVSLSVIPIIEVRGCYLQKGAAGLILEVVRLMVGQPKEQAGEKKAEFL